MTFKCNIILFIFFEKWREIIYKINLYTNKIFSQSRPTIHPNRET
ncbi:hypothetical protein BVRB_9g209580 [Beta vulgaris subsp. vulgaris]|nr:hypothetical protein BVRB_9g209580 [Beta vulgaris subsp. vulgaris]